MQTLEQLHLTQDCEFTEAGIKAFFNSRFIKSLHKLVIKNESDDFDPINVFFSFLARSENMQSLEELEVDSTSLTDASMKELMESAYMKKLKSLSIDSYGPENRKISDASVIAIAASPLMRNLESLKIKHFISKVGVSALANSPHLSQLKSLYIYCRPGREFKEDTAVALANSPYLLNLKELTIDEFYSKPEPILKAFALSTTLTNLLRLSIEIGKDCLPKLPRRLCQAAMADPLKNPQAWIAEVRRPN